MITIVVYENNHLHDVRCMLLFEPNRVVVLAIYDYDRAVNPIDCELLTVFESIFSGRRLLILVPGVPRRRGL